MCKAGWTMYVCIYWAPTLYLNMPNYNVDVEFFAIEITTYCPNRLGDRV